MVILFVTVSKKSLLLLVFFTQFNQKVILINMTVNNITSKEAYEILALQTAALVDVRTDKEWSTVGIPVLDQNKLVFLNWRLLPNMTINKEFAEKVLKISKDKTLFFLCRSGARSLEAAQFCTNIGYQTCYNITDGFEGNQTGAGWKYNNLPWQIL